MTSARAMAGSGRVTKATVETKAGKDAGANQPVFPAHCWEEEAKGWLEEMPAAKGV